MINDLRYFIHHGYWEHRLVAILTPIMMTIGATSPVATICGTLAIWALLLNVASLQRRMDQLQENRH